MQNDHNVIFFRREFSFEPEIKISTIEWSHLRSLRMNSQQAKLTLSDGEGRWAFYDLNPDKHRAQIISEIRIETPPPNIRIATAIPKGNRLDLLLQKGVELGIQEFIFVNFLQSERKDFNPERAERIFQEAMSQSKQFYFPKMQFASGIQELVEGSDRPTCLLDPRGDTHVQDSEFESHLLLIGPEGGFRQSEMSMVQESGIVRNLGSSILRIETAFLYTASLLRRLHIKY